MTQTRRTAPDPEWVLMYRRGIPTPKIAAGAGVAETTVRYHLAIAAKQEPGIRAEHQAALPVARQRLTAAGRRNLEDIIAFYQAVGRLPTRRSAREKALTAWLHHRRQEAAEGTLSPIYAEALDEIPGWSRPSTKQADDQARWKQRLAEVSAYRAVGNDWPRHNKTDDQGERVLGVWLHVQRMNERAGKLDPAKKAQLDEVIPGWRQGRPRRGPNSRPCTPGTSGSSSSG
ncbi:helicase associated domain-containing protein [Pseudarthrobacter sp. GA104]|uniref:helicase associated domain-containing protein n=1 Tax=Pseudarthrobacter sp. GA104 TaxID=2676311 RepID=UPI0012F8F007|nr:helicase associated domain-containing protein [Pseudarthrobacter sp. GA104]MUU70536.1 helicase-associated protein [Pseudarthrobacter sp. GA104]